MSPKIVEKKRWLADLVMARMNERGKSKTEIVDEIHEACDVTVSNVWLWLRENGRWMPAPRERKLWLFFNKYIMNGELQTAVHIEGRYIDPAEKELLKLFPKLTAPGLQVLLRTAEALSEQFGTKKTE